MTQFSNNQVFFEVVSTVTAVPSVDVGAPRREGDESYIYCYNAGNSQISQGFGVVLSAVTGYSVTVSSISSVDLCVAVCKHATMATGTYGWLLTQGFVDVKMSSGDSAAAGQLLTIGVDGTFAMKSNATGYPSPAVGKAMAAIASGAAGTAYIKVF